MKHEIEIPDLPEGYRAVAFRSPKEGEEYYSIEGLLAIAQHTFDRRIRCVIVEKIKPRRRVFECVSETPRKAKKGEWRQNGTDLSLTGCDETKFEYSIWREVKEES